MFPVFCKNLRVIIPLGHSCRNWGSGVNGYRVNETADPRCKYYAIGENAFIDELRAKQSRRAWDKMFSRKEMFDTSLIM